MNFLTNMSKLEEEDVDVGRKWQTAFTLLFLPRRSNTGTSKIAAKGRIEYATRSGKTGAGAWTRSGKTRAGPKLPQAEMQKCKRKWSSSAELQGAEQACELFNKHAEIHPNRSHGNIKQRKEG